MNQTQKVFFAILILIGLCFFTLAFFAIPLGIDNDPGWGKGRFFLLSLGIITLILAALIVLGKKLETFADPLFARFFKLNIPTWIKKPSLWVAVLMSMGLVVLASFSYPWLFTHGKLDAIPKESRYIPMLTDAFRSRQLYLMVSPSPELLALEDPYEPDQYLSVDALHDASLYEGHYYLYWGPVPALLLLLLPKDIVVGDTHLALFFVIALVLMITVFLLYIWRHYFSSLSWWAVLPGLIMLFWTTPLPFMYANPSIYDATIIASQVFLLLGLFFLIIGLSSERPRYLFIILSGIFWAMAAGTRVTSSLAILPLGGFLFLEKWQNPSWKRSQVLKSIGTLAIPLGIGAFGLFWYNYVRFGSFTQSGICYALSVVNMLKTCPNLFSTKYIPANLFLYLFHPYSIQPNFPFFFLNWLSEADFPFFIKLANDYYFSDPVAGMLFTMPFSLLFVGIGSVLVFSSRKGKDHTENSLFAGLSAAAFLALIILLFYFIPMPRYYADFSIMLGIAAMMGFWKALQVYKNRYFLRFMIILAAGLLILLGITVGFMTGISGLSHVFYEDNPALFNLMKNWFLALGLGS